MGCPVEPLEHLEKAILSEEHRDWRQVTEPVLVVSMKYPAGRIVFSVPGGRPGNGDQPAT